MAATFVFFNHTVGQTGGKYAFIKAQRESAIRLEQALTDSIQTLMTSYSFIMLIP